MPHGHRLLACHTSSSLHNLTFTCVNENHHRRTNNLPLHHQWHQRDRRVNFSSVRPFFASSLMHATCPLCSLSRHTSSLMPHVTCPLSCDTCQRPSSTDQQPSVCIIDGIGGTGESIFVLMSHTVSSLALCHMSSLSMPHPLSCRVTA